VISPEIRKALEVMEKEGIMGAIKAFSVEVVDEENSEDFNHWKDVWAKEGYFDNSPEEVEKHYQEYAKNKKDLIAYTNPKIFGKKEVVGTIRVIFNSQEGTPALNDFQIKESFQWLKKAECAEFTLLTVGKRWRKRELMHLPALVLYREACRQIKESGTDNIVFITDKKLRNAFENHIGFKVYKTSEEEPQAREEEKIRGGKREEGERWYEGGWCAAYYLNYSESLENLRRVNPPLYEFFEI